MRSRRCLGVLVTVLLVVGVDASRADPADTWTATTAEQSACLYWFRGGREWTSVELCGVVQGDAVDVMRTVRAVRTMRSCDGDGCSITTTVYEGEATPAELVIDDAATAAVFSVTVTGADPADRCAVQAVARRTTWDEPSVGGHQPLIMHGPRPGEDPKRRWVMLNHPDHQHLSTVEVDVDSGEVRAQHQGWSRSTQSGPAEGWGQVCDWVVEGTTTHAWLSSSDAGAARVSATVGAQPG